MWTVHGQAWRIEHHVRLHLGIARSRAEHPEVDVALLEPPRDDATLFLANPMSFVARREVLEAGYAHGRAFLAAEPLPFRAASERTSATAPALSTLPLGSPENAS